VLTIFWYMFYMRQAVRGSARQHRQHRQAQQTAQTNQNFCHSSKICEICRGQPRSTVLARGWYRHLFGSIGPLLIKTNQIKSNLNPNLTTTTTTTTKKAVTLKCENEFEFPSHLLFSVPYSYYSYQSPSNLYMPIGSLH
jgi:hypothetical protein